MARRWGRRRLLGVLAGTAGLAAARATAARDDAGPTVIREVLAADRTYYVRSDALYTDAPGLIDSTAGACKTWAQAVALVVALDFNGHNVTIQHGSEGAHTFRVNVAIDTLTGGGSLTIRGSATPNNTVFDTTGTGLGCFTLRNTVTSVAFTNLKVMGDGTGLIQPTDCAIASIGSGVIFGPATNAHIWVHDNQAKAYLLGASYTINGSAPYHLFCNMGIAFIEAVTVTLTGTPAFAAFVAAINCGAIQAPAGTGNIFAGAATGARYSASTNGAINTFGGGASYFPGNAVGATSTGGQYA
jgi:hypothetical protein